MKVNWLAEIVIGMAWNIGNSAGKENSGHGAG